MFYMFLKQHTLFRGMLLCLICGFYTTTLLASQDYWPTHGWRTSTPEAQGIDSEKLIEMMERIHNENYAIDNFTIIRNGYLDGLLRLSQDNHSHQLQSRVRTI